jgi:hypothetical protein
MILTRSKFKIDCCTNVTNWNTPTTRQTIFIHELPIGMILIGRKLQILCRTNQINWNTAACKKTHPIAKFAGRGILIVRRQSFSTQKWERSVVEKRGGEKKQ